MIKRSLFYSNCFKLSKTVFSLSTHCWSCKRNLDENELKSCFCPCSRKQILPVNLKSTYFDLFHLNADYKIEKHQLTKLFRQLMRKLHPDLFTLESEVRILLVIFRYLFINFIMFSCNKNSHLLNQLV